MITTLIGIQTAIVGLSTGYVVYRVSKKGYEGIKFKTVQKRKDGYRHYKIS